MSLRGLYPCESANECTFQVHVNHMAEYQELIKTAQKQLEDLRKTLRELECLEVKMDITF